MFPGCFKLRLSYVPSVSTFECMTWHQIILISVCGECSTRMRVLCSQNECPICRQDIQKVILLTFIFYSLQYCFTVFFRLKTNLTEHFYLQVPGKIAFNIRLFANRHHAIWMLSCARTVSTDRYAYSPENKFKGSNFFTMWGL